jgi:hypothetical protein
MRRQLISPASKPFRFPGDTDRLAIVGRTGSGKTVAAVWHLSLRNYDQKPWIVYDFKGDELINSIEGAQYLDVTEPPPNHPGVYIVRLHPFDVESGALENQLRQIWERGDVGVYVDEGYMLGQRNNWFRSLLTQGRSKHIPMIVLSQRPVWMDRFVFSESEFFQVFHLQHDDDKKIVEGFLPGHLRKDPETGKRIAPLPEYWSYYADIKAGTMRRMKPVPDGDAILDTFARRLARIPRTA